MRSSLKYLLLPTSTLLIHSAFVEANRSIHESKVRTSLSVSRDFRPGATDDILLDTTQTGDIVLKRRRWYLHHFPEAISILLYRYLLGSQYDKLGVIVVDSYGKSWLVERNVYTSGLDTLLLAEKLKLSQAELIALIPIVPRKTSSNNDNNGIHKLANVPATIQQFQFRRPLLGSEISSITSFILYSCINKCRSQLFPSIDIKRIDCPNLQFFRLISKWLGQEVHAITTTKPPQQQQRRQKQHEEERSNEGLTIKDIEERNIVLYSIPSSSSYSSRETMFLAEDAIMLRTR